MKLWLDDHIDLSIWWKGHYEETATRMFLSLLKPGDCVLDVGANIGYYTILAASRVGNSGQVLAFEPVSSTFSRLRANVRSIPFVKPVQAACGDEDGSVDIFVSDYRANGNSGCSRILRPLTDCPLVREEVPLVRLDSFLEESSTAKVDLVKIDVEGYELRVFRGMPSTITSNPDIKILVEICAKYVGMAGSTTEAFFDYLGEYGLRPWRFTVDAGGERRFERREGYWGDESLVLFARDRPLTR